MSNTKSATKVAKTVAPKRVAVKKFTAKDYRLTGDRSGLAYVIKTGKRKRLLVFDEDKGFSRPIRHCPNESSIFADEQNEFSYVEPIFFMHGYLSIDRESQITQKFLDNSPENVANGGNLFEAVDDEKEASGELEMSELKVDIYNAVRKVADSENGEYKLEAVVAVLEDSVTTASEMQMSSLKRRLYQEIESNPWYFCDDHGNVTVFEDDYITRKYFILRAIKEAVIKKSANTKSMVWVRDNKSIVSAPRGVELTDYFTDFLATEEGMLVAEEIKKRS